MPELVILGATARAAAASAARAGFQPYSIDLFADEDTRGLGPAVRSQRFPADFPAALAAAPDAPWIYTGGLENHPRLVDQLAKLRPLWGNSGSVLRQVRDPARLRDVLAAGGFAYPPTILPGEAVPLGDAADWLVKPLRGSAGMGVRLASATDRKTSPRGSILQRYIAGESCSAVFVAAGGRARLVGASRQLIGRDWDLAKPFLYVGSIGPLELSDAEQAKLVRLGDTLAREFHLVGLSNIDFIRTPDEIGTIEVNPRYSASVEVLERATALHFVKLHVAACASGQLPAERTPNYSGFWGKAVVYARQDGTATASLQQLANDCSQPGQWPQIADIPANGQPIHAGQPVVTVFADGKSATEVEERLREKAVIVQNAIRA